MEVTGETRDFKAFRAALLETDGIRGDWVEEVLRVSARDQEQHARELVGKALAKME